MSPLTHRISRSTWYLLAAIYVSMFALTVANVFYTNRVAETNARKWCALLVTLDETYQRQAPQTAPGRQVAADIHQLRTDIRCAAKTTPR